MEDAVPPSSQEDASRRRGATTGEHLRRRAELAATFFLAVASVLTAWSAFQATKWSGLQAIAFSEAAAARAESTRATTRSTEARQIDITLVLAWLQALAREQAQGAAGQAGHEHEHGYEPRPGTVSGFLFERFRSEFRPAMRAWLATHPLENPSAPPSPFAMPEYVLATEATAHALAVRADERAAVARERNRQSDDYVATTVVFSLVLFFAGVATKLEGRAARWALLGGAGVFLIAGAVRLATFPVALG
jgi:hypothetical protein